MERANEEAERNMTLRNGAFQINSDEETFVQEASAQGFTEEQIISGIVAKRNLVTGSNSEEDPFKGKTRTQFLKEAFMGGVTSNTELEKLGKTYDLLKGTKEAGAEFSTTNKLKLEQAGLLDAPRQEQLNYLYGETAYRFCLNEKGIKE